MIFRYPGGKSKVADWIISHAPLDVGEYREPMVGGGGVFFRMGSAIPSWIADVNPGLIEVYRALQRRPKQFIAACRAIPHDGLRDAFERLKLDESADQALRYYLINRVGWGGRVNYALPSRLFFSNPTGWRIVDTDKLERASERLRNTHISCCDYRALMLTPGERVWVYLDPPYVKNTELQATSKLYQDSFTDEDHIALWDVFRRCKHNVALSYDDTAFIRYLYRDYRIIEKQWNYSGSSQKTKTRGKEILILNYESPNDVRRSKRISSTRAPKTLSGIRR